MKAEWTNKDSLSIESTGQKAILVLDMPNECDGCPCLNQKLWECQADKKRRSSDERPSWCPLKPLPEKLYVEANSIEDVMPSEFDIDKFALKIRLDADKLCALGWNACIDEILGETE